MVSILAAAGMDPDRCEGGAEGGEPYRTRRKVKPAGRRSGRAGCERRVDEAVQKGGCCVRSTEDKQVVGSFVWHR